MVEERLQKILGITEKQIKTNDFHSLGIDSLTFIKKIVEIENEFDIEFSDEELNYDMFNTFAELCKIIESKIQNGRNDFEM